MADPGWVPQVVMVTEDHNVVFEAGADPLMKVVGDARGDVVGPRGRSVDARASTKDRMDDGSGGICRVVVDDDDRIVPARQRDMFSPLRF